MEDKIPGIMESVFDCTMTMINKDFHEYPEHRIQFFKLLQAINLYCFQALLKVDPIKFKSVIDCCMWAAKHDNREVENTGLTMCLELVDNMAETDLQTSSIFFRQFYLPILQDLLFVLTDSDHKAGMFFFFLSHLYVSAISRRLTILSSRIFRLQVSSHASVTDVLLCGIWQGSSTHLPARGGADWAIQQRILADVHRKLASN